MHRHKVIVILICIIPAWLSAEELSLVTNDTTPAVTFRLEFNDAEQTIRHFGSSTGMRAGWLAEHWPENALDRMAGWVFSRELDETGSPVGIALSSFRFEIGAGTAYKDESGIRREWRETECYLLPDGTYDWSKSAGDQYWMRQAEQYQVPVTIGYSNSPPIYWTKSGDGYKYRKSMTSNLRPDRYDDYAEFLARVATHFEDKGIGFDYICPVNEPQWPWQGSPTSSKQEGSPWTNEQIWRITRATNAAFQKHGVNAEILITEAGAIDYLFKFRENDFATTASDQIFAFWDDESPLYLGDLSHLASRVAGHSYWTDTTDQMIVDYRRKLASAIADLPMPLDFWQTEYSLLGDGYREGKSHVSEMDAALFLAKMIHYDLTVANAAAWQFWATFNHGRPAGQAQRYTLVAAESPEEIRPTKNLWILGHFSRFVRPGMQRIDVRRSDHLTAVESGQHLMVSAFRSTADSSLVAVLVNYEDTPITVRLTTAEMKNTAMPLIPFVTTAQDQENLRRYEPINPGDPIALPARSVTTLTSGRIPIR